jgi:O-acetyl-ADP-ribose deacetylase (regulator of RNase III)/uncharacterized protein YwgA
LVKIIKGDIFESKAQTLVNSVNCVGVMGKGIALEFKKRFPEMYEDYVEKCKKNQVKLGKPYLYKYKERWILNFPTKEHWRSVSQLKDIEEGLKYLVEHYKEWGITSIAVPPLGCGQGRLEWKVAGPLLYKYLSKLEIPVELYVPFNVSEKELNIDNSNLADKPFLADSIKPSWFAIVEILYRIEKQPYHWSVGRTKFQKIAYIATKEGIPTELVYKKASYGPFSEQLKDVMAKLINNNLIQEKRYNRMFLIKVGPAFFHMRKMYFEEINQWDPIIEKIADLFIRIDTVQSEIATTVIFSAEELRQNLGRDPSEMEVLEYVLEWKRNRQPLLSKDKIAYTIRNLAALNWLKVQPSKELPVIYDF